MWKINEKLNEITRKLDKLERRSGALARRSSVLSTNTTSADKWNEVDEDDQAEMDDNRDMSNQSAAAMRSRKWKPAASEAWLNERCLRRAERDYLDPEEETFWTDVIEKYLTPIAVDQNEQERIRIGLTELRNKVSYSVVVWCTACGARVVAERMRNLSFVIFYHIFEAEIYHILYRNNSRGLKNWETILSLVMETSRCMYMLFTNPRCSKK